MPIKLTLERSPRLSVHEPLFYTIRWPCFRQFCLGSWALTVEW